MISNECFLCNDPNVVPVAFKDVTDDGKLVVGDVFLETTLNNIKENNGKIAISAYDAQSLESTNKFHSNFKKYHLHAIMRKKLEGDFVWRDIRKN